jgi:pyrimidine-nucleoside phosphorylase
VPVLRDGSGALNPVRLVEAARDGEPLPEGALEAFLEAYRRGGEGVEDYHVAAFLMAVVFRGLAPGDLSRLVRAMLGSGVRLDLSHLPGPRVDKHSTGGVGDKASLPLAPLVAEGGLFVPMMAGRGLGHTGGTVDKLESIRGYRTDLELDEFVSVVETVGCSIVGQTEEIAALDRRLYALRSVTGTVPSIPLVAASIMSKKLAEDLTGLVLDVKVGRGAFFPEEARALELARTMVGIGGDHGVATSALLTSMERPLGRAVGNALEVAEAVACLRGEGPGDLRDLVLTLAGEMFRIGGIVPDARVGRERAEQLLDGGGPLGRFRRMVDRHGGDPRIVDDPGRLPAAPVVREVRAEAPGRVLAVDPLSLGRGVVELGGGRTRLDQDIDPSVGFVLHVVPGDDVAPGDLLGRVHAASEPDARRGETVLRAAVEVGPSGAEVEPRPLVGRRVAAGEPVDRPASRPGPTGS